MTTGKTIALTRWTFVGKVISQLFNILSRLVITFLPRSKCLSSAVILEPQKIKSGLVSTVSPSISHEVIYPLSIPYQSLLSLSTVIPYETMETVTDFIFLGSKITADGDCSHEIKRCLLLRRKVMANLDGIFKSSDITLPTNVHLVRAMVFPVVMYGCEHWTVKKAGH